ncbi:hypothetical protein LN996_20805 [Arthrobacter sp. AK01]|uniref:hypothetical protein n=1 Tax=Arthrobacter sp. AK01 TaxID=2894084 RepID=UPI001E2AF8F6|nr:hypothetical protein [Arthrobacter sp. AK01]MCD4853266.1 hypothetical protein [Arthrobacter sp. AK01]
MNRSEGPQRSVVRLFPDYADSVLWLDVPISYELTGLTEGLVHELRDWEQFYYESLTRDFTWKSADRTVNYTTEGHRLAQRVADELGDGYEVEFRSYEENARTHRFRGTNGPNPRAVAAFDVLVAVARAEKDRITRALKASPSGEGTGWFATSPISGSVFKPPREVQE